MPFDTTPTHAWALENLSQPEYEALLRVRDDLDSGKIPPESFDMRNFTNEWATCGTTHCIGGWMTHYMRLPYHIASTLHCDPRFNSLFFGFTRATNNRLPDTTEAVVAIDRFLSTGVGWLRKGPSKSHSRPHIYR